VVFPTLIFVSTKIFKLNLLRLHPVVHFLLILALFFCLDPVSLTLESAHAERGRGFKLMVSILPAGLELEVKIIGLIINVYLHSAHRKLP